MQIREPEQPEFVYTKPKLEMSRRGNTFLTQTSWLKSIEKTRSFWTRCKSSRVQITLRISSGLKHSTSSHLTITTWTNNSRKSTTKTSVFVKNCWRSNHTILPSKSLIKPNNFKKSDTISPKTQEGPCPYAVWMQDLIVLPPIPQSSTEAGWISTTRRGIVVNRKSTSFTRWHLMLIWGQKAPLLPRGLHPDPTLVKSLRICVTMPPLNSQDNSIHNKEILYKSNEKIRDCVRILLFSLMVPLLNKFRTGLIADMLKRTNILLSILWLAASIQQACDNDEQCPSNSVCNLRLQTCKCMDGFIGQCNISALVLTNAPITVEMNNSDI